MKKLRCTQPAAPTCVNADRDSHMDADQSRRMRPDRQERTDTKRGEDAVGAARRPPMEKLNATQRMSVQIQNSTYVKRCGGNPLASHRADFNEEEKVGQSLLEHVGAESRLFFP